MATGSTMSGECHCRLVQVTVRLSRPAEEIELRACQCLFCRRHGAATFADPLGHATILVPGEPALQRYHFGYRTADYLLCRECGVYIGALLDTGDAEFSTINAAGLQLKPFRRRTARPVSYGAETAEERIRRRKCAWMPTRIDIPAALKLQPSFH
jgi:hypothetical protein